MNLAELMVWIDQICEEHGCLKPEDCVCLASNEQNDKNQPESETKECGLESRNHGKTLSSAP
jgi:hypothetical protein